MANLFNSTWDCIIKVRQENPLVTMFTNIVSAAFSANILLAIGASPLVTTAEEEIADLMKSTKSLLLNMGTPDEKWIHFAQQTFLDIHKKGTIPVIFDPVGVGCSDWRNTIALEIMKNDAISVVRGNASEIIALAGLLGNDISTIPKKQNGVDSTLSAYSALESAKKVAKEHSCVIMISGAVDIVTDGTQSVEIVGGNALMPTVTGIGCSLTATIASMCAVEKDPFIATIAGTILFSAIGAKVGSVNKAPGTFSVAFLDNLYGCVQDELSLYSTVNQL